MKSLNLLKSFSIFSVLFIFVSCGGGGKIVDNIKVNTSTVDQDLYLGFDATLNFAGMTLPSVTFPIFHPKGNGQIGELSMSPIAGGKNQLGLDINLSEITGLGSSNSTLPNGNVLPLIASNDAVVIGVGPNGKIKIYLSIVDGAQAIGVAIPISVFDAIGAKVGATSLFPVFNISGVIGSAGMYTSSQAGLNGFGLFIDVHSIMNQIPNKNSKALVSMRSTLSVESSAQIDYRSFKPSRSKEKKINRMLYDLSRKKVELK